MRQILIIFAIISLIVFIIEEKYILTKIEIRKKQLLVTPAPSLIQTFPVSPTIINQANIIDSNVKTVNGIAYLSPNPGEGMSVKYTEIIDGKTYSPFLPLRNSLPPNVVINTKIINSNNQNIQMSKIIPGDSLAVKLSSGPCIAGIKGGWSGCLVKIYFIQDLSL